MICDDHISHYLSWPHNPWILTATYLLTCLCHMSYELGWPHNSGTILATYLRPCDDHISLNLFWPHIPWPCDDPISRDLSWPNSRGLWRPHISSPFLSTCPLWWLVMTTYLILILATYLINHLGHTFHDQYLPNVLIGMYFLFLWNVPTCAVWHV
jgi:hypothetical protein